MKNSCLICNSKRSTLLHRINNYPIVKCKKCSFIYITPLPSKRELQNFYKNYKHDQGFANEELIRYDAKRTIRKLKSLGYKNGDLLDVGCGAGFLMDEARMQGWETFGIDMATKPITYASAKLKLNVAQKNINEFKPNLFFDVITLIQLIEHLTEPYRTLEKVRTLLKQDGIICLATPNIESLLYKVLKDRFPHLIPPEHVAYYSPATLSKLLNKAGFKVVKTTTYGYAEDVGAIYRAIRTRKNPIIQTVRPIPSKKSANIHLQAKMSLKHYIFENVIRETVYPFLNIGNHGAMIEMYAKKR